MHKPESVTGEKPYWAIPIQVHDIQECELWKAIDELNDLAERLARQSHKREYLDSFEGNVSLDESYPDFYPM